MAQGKKGQGGDYIGLIRPICLIGLLTNGTNSTNLTKKTFILDSGFWLLNSDSLNFHFFWKF
jgi:hypothetical protein